MKARVSKKKAWLLVKVVVCAAAFVVCAYIEEPFGAGVAALVGLHISLCSWGSDR
jgi:hypothetical protein